jgi:hypothetical protein
MQLRSADIAVSLVVHASHFRCPRIIADILRISFTGKSFHRLWPSPPSVLPRSLPAPHPSALAPLDAPPRHHMRVGHSQPPRVACHPEHEAQLSTLPSHHSASAAASVVPSLHLPFTSLGRNPRPCKGLSASGAVYPTLLSQRQPAGMPSRVTSATQQLSFTTAESQRPSAARQERQRPCDRREPTPHGGSTRSTVF